MWEIRRRWRRCWRRGRGPRPWMVTGAAGLLVFFLITGFLETRLRPMVVTAAQAQAQNRLSAVMEHAILTRLGEDGVSYTDFVTIQRDEAGEIAAVTTDAAALNRLRAELMGVVLAALNGVDVSQIQIPLGSLLDFDLIWGLGPTMKVHAMTVGTVEGEFSSEFSSAGVNQTLHKIDLDLEVPLTLMLPGGAVETVCETRVPIAETVIVGQVPKVVLQSGTGEGSAG